MQGFIHSGRHAATRAKAVIVRNRGVSSVVGIVLLGALSWGALSQSGPSTFKLVQLASEPLYAAGAGQKPTLSLALSVEFPTVGAQYTPGGTEDATYSPAFEYIGYFDASSCYAYVNALSRFDRIGPATDRTCNGTGFSGNFMNWATSSAIDMLRLGLTGGDRIVDERDTTVLQRAVLRLGSFYNDSNFPAKKLTALLAAGAVPSTLLGQWKSDVWISNCLDRVHFGTEKTGNCDNPGNNADLGVAVPDANGIDSPSHGSSALSSKRFFYTRVKVCDVSGGVLQDPRKDLCQRYNSGYYKPVGNLQRHSDKVRVAAFGYLMDNRQARYGGVLRAPMKFVGPRGFDANGAALSSNPSEWHPDTGVFDPNPEHAAEGVSGVINYLNKFGRTGTEGVYKVHDPVGELYYESLRYVQGLPPTEDATAGMTESMKDGFPVYTSWTDPHASGTPSRNYSCLRNNIVVIGDVNTHNDKSIPGNTERMSDYEVPRPANASANEPNFVEWTRVVAGFESNTSVAYQDAQGAARTTFNPNPSTSQEAPLSDLADIATRDTGATKAAYYIAGMAYWANTHDIRGSQWTDSPSKQRPGMRVHTYLLDVNEGGSQNTTSTRHRNQYFLAGKYGAFKDPSATGNPFVAADGLTLDNGNWKRSGPGSEPSGYYLSSSAKEVIAALNAIFDQVIEAGSSIAGGSVSSQQVGPNGAFIYQASFNPDRWHGDVTAKRLTYDADSSAIDIENGNTTWSAAARLATKSPADRRIYIGKADRTQANATAFTWDAIENSPGALQDQLKVPAPGVPADAFGEERLAFLRGDRSNEGTLFRARGGRLGDIVNSGVVYSGAPSQRFSTTGYRTFYDSHKSRTPAVFVGANDGMLHAFNASTGDEIFGYIPSWLGPKLSALSAPTYGSSPSHQSYVDATPRVAEAEIVSGTTTSYKTVLVGGTGAGGQGVYALDVSDPTAFDASKVMWEFTDRDDPDLGNVVGRPQILRFRTSAPGATTATYRSFAVVASGVNNTTLDGFASSTGQPAIFLLDLSKTVGTAWALGTNYYKISLPVDATLAATMAPGVLEFRAAAGVNGEVTHLYAGDLHGNLWKFDFTMRGASGTDWTSGRLSPFVSGGVAHPLFIARDSTETAARQPISMPPTLIAGPKQSIIVSFGTGRYLEIEDNAVNAATQKQSVYALYDPLSYQGLSASSGASAIASRARLQAGTAVAGGAITVPSFAWGWPMSNTDTSKRSGWYFDMPTSGERQVSASAAAGTTLVFGSLIPPNAATDPCGAGNGYQYMVDVATGNGESLASTVGLLGEPLVLQGGSARSSDTNSVGQQSQTTSWQIILQGALGTKRVDAPLQQTRLTGRLSWRRINNYLELKNE